MEFGTKSLKHILSLENPKDFLKYTDEEMAVIINHIAHQKGADKALEIGMHFCITKQACGKTATKCAQIATREEKLLVAKTFIERALQVDPYDVVTQIQRVGILEKLGMDAEARQELNKILECRNAMELVPQKIAKILKALGQSQEAYQISASLIQEYSDVPQYLEFHLEVLFCQYRKEEALEFADRLQEVRAYPISGLTRGIMCDVFYHNGQEERAVKMARRDCKDRLSDTLIQRVLLCDAMSQGQWEIAYQLLEPLFLKPSPHPLDQLYHARCLANMGAYARASAIIQRVKLQANQSVHHTSQAIEAEITMLQGSPAQAADQIGALLSDQIAPYSPDNRIQLPTLKLFKEACVKSGQWERFERAVNILAEKGYLNPHQQQALKDYRLPRRLTPVQMQTCRSELLSASGRQAHPLAGVPVANDRRLGRAG